MNIYLHVEVGVRETDSKLLLAIIAAAKGHEVLLSNLEPLEKGIQRGYLLPGIFHTKSLTPSKYKINRHDIIVKKGSKITSIDEESGLARNDYELMSQTRYSEKTIQQVSAIFTWGQDDFETLNRCYPKYSEKIFKTGSPRVDLWKPKFSKFWLKPKNSPIKPFLLIPSSMNVCGEPLFKSIEKQIQFGYFDRYPSYFEELFKIKGNDFLKAFEFIEAIKYLSKHNKGYDIVFRPHPVESSLDWKNILGGIPNTHIIDQGSITSWVKNSFAVMHNGCTTGVETIVSNKPLITYAPHNLLNDKYLTNNLGHIVRSKEDLLNKINSIFENNMSGGNDYIEKKLPAVLQKKIYIDDDELAANKIVKIWEELDDQKLSKKNNWSKFKLRLRIMKFNGFIGRIIRSILKGKLEIKKQNPKFPAINISEIQTSVKNLQNHLGIKEKLECRLLSKNTILIKLH